MKTLDTLLPDPSPANGYNSDEDVQHVNSYEVIDKSLEYFTYHEDFEDEDTVVTAIDKIDEMLHFFKCLQGKLKYNIVFIN